MVVKFIEIRDVGTLIPALAISTTPDNEIQEFLFDRSGFGKNSKSIILLKLTCDGVAYDPFEWLPSRTMHYAHLWINDHFSEIRSGDVVDVEYITGLSDTRKESARKARGLNQ